MDAKRGWKRAEFVEKSGAFLGFVNNQLLPHLQGLRHQPNATATRSIHIDPERRDRILLPLVRRHCGAG